MSQSDHPARFQAIIKTLGPGLIFAGTSIGVSHVVQSTRAGAIYGFALLWAVLAANIFKFPFFEFAPRYVTATGEHLLKGYRRVGSWAFYLFFILSLCTMFPIQAAVTLVATGLFVNLVQWPYAHVYMSILILGVCCAILLAGKYPLLDKLMKVMIIILGVSTFVAFLAAVWHGPSAQPHFENPFVWDLKGVTFLLALMGWMPTTLEISVWHSFWCAERRKQTRHDPSMGHALFDFHLGYWGTMVMAAFFLSLGALVMYATGETFADGAAAFTAQVVNLYTKALGPWSYWIIATAAAVTMFSTTIACLDAFPRVIREASMMIWPSLEGKGERIYLVWIIIISAVSATIIGVFINRITALIDFATVLAFLATPVFAYINLCTVTADHVPADARPSAGMIAYSWFCIFILGGFGIFYIVWRFLV